MTDQQKIAQLERELAQARAQHAALESGVQDTISAACDQIRIALAINGWLYGMAQWARKDLANTVQAMHVVHREETYCDLLEVLTDGDSKKRDEAAKEAKAVVATVRANSEQLRVRLRQRAMMHLSECVDRACAELDEIVRTGGAA